MVRSRPLFLALAALVLLSACSGDGPRPDRPPAAAGVSGTVVVLAATSLATAFGEIEAAFEHEHPGTDVVVNFAGSSALATQILEGAPADVFASADTANMAELTDVGAAGEPAVFATNRLEIIVERGNPLDISGLADLADPELVVAVCAPEVPCGAYAAEVLAAAGLTVAADTLEENVGAVTGKVLAGEADAGIVYATDVAAHRDAADGVPIPADVNVAAAYPIAVTAEAANPAAAAAFVGFVTGPAGRATLTSHGFTEP